MHLASWRFTFNEAALYQPIPASGRTTPADFVPYIILVLQTRPTNPNPALAHARITRSRDHPSRYRATPARPARHWTGDPPTPTALAGAAGTRPRPARADYSWRASTRQVSAAATDVGTAILHLGMSGSLRLVPWLRPSANMITSTYNSTAGRVCA